MKVFLSHRMSGVSEEEIMKIREDARVYLEARYDNIEIIDNYHHDDAPEDAGRLWHLGRSIQMLEEADAIFFIPHQCNAKGCLVEMNIAEIYELQILL